MTDFLISLSDPPDIAVEKSWIHSGEGFEAQLVCIVHADPQPSVSSFVKNTKYLEHFPKLFVSEEKQISST